MSSPAAWLHAVVMIALGFDCAGSSAPRPRSQLGAAPAPRCGSRVRVPPGSERTQPARDEIVTAMHALRGPIESCARGNVAEPALNVTYTVAGATGFTTVESVVTSPGSQPVPVGVLRCVERAFARVCFTPFAQPTLRLQVPFVANPEEAGGVPE